MLKVINSKAAQTVELSMDSYIPMMFRNLTEKCPSPYYWRTGNLTNQLLEIGLNPDTGAIYEVTISVIDTIRQIPDEHFLVYNDIAPGIPVCDLSIWPPRQTITDWHKENFVDEKRAFVTTISANSLIIQLCDMTTLHKGYKVESVFFGTDVYGCLCSLEFQNIASNHLTDLLSLTANSVDLNLRQEDDKQ